MDNFPRKIAKLSRIERERDGEREADRVCKKREKEIKENRGREKHRRIQNVR